MKRRVLAFLLFIFIGLFCKAQNNQRRNPFLSVDPRDTEPPKILMKDLKNSNVQFTASLRPLRQIPGAQKPFWTYFWEFGDGTFSDAAKDGQPVHRYKASGNYQVRLYATNNYDNGMAPPANPQPFSVQVTAATTANERSNFFGRENIKMKLNRKPKPNEGFVAYLGYQNRLRNNLQGSLVIFFNEDAKYKRKMFSLDEIRTYHGENKSSLEELLSRLQKYSTRKMLKPFQKEYSENVVLRFNSMPANQERFVFLSMKATPEMFSDTNAVITMKAVLIPDDPSLDPEVFELESELVGSRDPNRMLLKEKRINYRFMKRKKELTYTVQFQNIGEGPSENISVGIHLPKQLNKGSLNIKKVSPGSITADPTIDGGQGSVDTVMRADSIYFRFKNIHLPGLKEELIHDEDMTKGFVKYTIRFIKSPKKIPFSSRAVIVFDKNDPINTNFATARFMKGLSPGIVAGYNFLISEGSYSAKGPIQIGYVLAPYAPYRLYLQLELHVGISEQEQLLGLQQTLKNTNHFLQVVPFHLRYNLSNWIGIGLGVMGQLRVSKVDDNWRRALVAEKKELAPSTTIAPFADIQIGKVRTGPTVGMRYFRLSEGNLRNRFFVYVGIKL